MDKMKMLITMIFIAACIIMVVTNKVKQWWSKDKEEKIKNVKEWLLYEVTEAEKLLGSGTGKLKLRYVYDKAVSKFPLVANVPFKTFSVWVDSALDEFKQMLDTNNQVRNYVLGIECNELVEPEEEDEILKKIDEANQEYLKSNK